jgi:hypothetical protein
LTDVHPARSRASVRPTRLRVLGTPYRRAA